MIPYIYVDVAPAGRKPLLLLPRTVPSNQVGEIDETTKPASIFGVGKPRDINKPEIKELEERLEHSLAISKQKAAEAAAAAAAAAANTSGLSDSGINTSPLNERERTTSTNSSNR